MLLNSACFYTFLNVQVGIMGGGGGTGRLNEDFFFPVFKFIISFSYFFRKILVRLINPLSASPANLRNGGAGFEQTRASHGNTPDHQGPQGADRVGIRPEPPSGTWGLQAYRKGKERGLLSFLTPRLCNQATLNQMGHEVARVFLPSLPRSGREAESSCAHLVPWNQSTMATIILGCHEHPTGSLRLLTHRGWP